MHKRNLSDVVIIAFTCLLLVAADAAYAQTSVPSTQPSAQTPQATPAPEQPQSEPSQQSPAATPVPEPQQTPANDPAASQSSEGNSQAAGSAQSNQPKSIDEELQLTADQKQKIAAVVDDENRQISAVRDDNSMSLEQKQQKVMQIRQAGTPKIKSILTPDQLQRLAAIQQRMREQNGGAGSQTGSQTGTQNGNPGATTTPQR